MEEKIITYTMDAGNQPLIVTTIDSLFDALRGELECALSFNSPEDEVAEISIQVARNMTQKEVDDLPEWEG